MCARGRLSRRGRRFLPLTQTHQQGNKGEERAAAAAPHNAGALLSMTCDGGTASSPPLPCSRPPPCRFGGAQRDPQTGHPLGCPHPGGPTLKSSFCLCRINPCHLGARPRCCSFGVVAPQNPPCPWGEVREVPGDVTATLSSAPAPTPWVSVLLGTSPGLPVLLCPLSGFLGTSGWVLGSGAGGGELRAWLELPQAHRDERRIWGSDCSLPPNLVPFELS